MLFPVDLSKTVIGRALKDAARVGQAALKSEAKKHDDVGQIRVNMRTLKRRIAHLSDAALSVQRNYGRDGVAYIAVGFEWPYGAHGWLVEHGHRMVTGGTVARLGGKAPNAKREELTGKGRVVGFVAAHPIAKPAFDASVDRMETTFLEQAQSRGLAAAGILATSLGLTA